MDLSGLSESLGLIRMFICVELYTCHHVYRVGQGGWVALQRSPASIWLPASLPSQRRRLPISRCTHTVCMFLSPTSFRWKSRSFVNSSWSCRSAKS